MLLNELCYGTLRWLGFKIFVALVPSLWVGDPSVFLSCTLSICSSFACFEKHFDVDKNVMKWPGHGHA